MPDGDENSSPSTTPDQQQPVSQFSAQEESEMKRMKDDELKMFLHDYITIRMKIDGQVETYVSPSGDTDFENKVNNIFKERLEAIDADPSKVLVDPYAHPKPKPDAPTPDGNNIAKEADPVNLFDGNFYYSSTDFVIAGAGMDCAFTRTYSNQSLYSGPIGNKWDHSYNLWLRTSDNFNVIFRSNGGLAETTYRRHNVHGYWLSEYGDDGIIVETNDGFIWRNTAGTEFEYLPLLSTRDDLFLVQRITDRFGNFLRFEYEDGLLMRIIVNHPDRTVSFRYNTSNQLISAQDFTGRIWQYRYDDLDDLVVVITPATEEFRSGVHTCYEYNTATVSDPLLQHNLIAIIDADNQIYLENEYGDVPGLLSYNRVVRQRQGGGQTIFDYEDVVEEFEFPYPSHQRPAFQTIVTQRNGQQVRYLFNRFGNPVFREEYAIINGIPKLIGTHLRYNKDGNLIGTISPSGTISQFLYVRDYYERIKNIDEDYVDTEDADLDIRTRQGFNRLLASVRRGRYHALASLNFTNGLWSDIFPDIFATGDEDIIRKFTYEQEFGQILTVSDPRHTESADPAFTESQAYQDHLTQYIYAAGNGSAFHLLDTIQSPAIHFPDGTTGPPALLRFAAYDDNGRVLETIDAGGLQTSITYFDSTDGILEGFLKEMEVDRGGLSIRSGVERDTLGRVVSSFLPKSFDTADGRFIVKNEYDALDRITKQTSSAPFNFTSIKQYDRTGKVKKEQADRIKPDNTPETDPLLIRTYDYDEELNLRKATVGGEDVNAHKRFRYLYDSSGRLTFSISPSGIKSKVAYNERSLLSKEIADFGGVAATTKKFFDADGRAVRVKDAVGAEYRFVYDAFDRLMEAEDPFGNKRYFTYDKLGNVIVDRFFEKVDGSRYRLMSRSQQSFDELGRKITSAINRFEGDVIVNGDPSDQFVQTGPGVLLEVQQFYDNADRVVKVIDQVGRVYRTVYDKVGRPVTSIDPLGNERMQQYDKHNNLVRVDVKETIRDAANNVVGHRCFATSFIYDELNRLVERTDTLGNKTRYEYNSQGQATKIIDPLLNVAENEYDIFGRIASTSRILKQPPAADERVTASFQYDTDDFLLQHTDALGRITKFRRDTIGRLVSVTMPDGSSDLTAYDRAGRVTEYTDANGVTRNFQRDIMGRVSRVQVNATPTVEGSLFSDYRYDGAGRLVFAENEFCRYGYTYNSMSWLLEESAEYIPPAGSANTQTFSVKRNYFDTGAMSGLIYPSGREINYERDTLDRLTSIAQSERGQNYSGNPAQPNAYTILNFDYEGLQQKTITRHNQTSTVFQYDFGGRLIEMTHSSANNTVARMQYLYDGANNVRNRTVVSDEINQTKVFNFDSLYRLQEIAANSPATLVNAGALQPPQDLLPATIPDSQAIIDGLLPSSVTAQKKFIYDKCGNRITVEENNAVTENYVTNTLDQYTSINTTNFTYATNGNLVEDTDWIYKYNFRNQLTSLENKTTGKRLEFYYDPSGKKIMESNDGELSMFVYDALNVIEEHKDDDLRSSILCGDETDTVFQLSERNAEFLAYTDLVKSVTYLFNGDNRHNHYEYDEFGNTIASTLPNDPNVYGFTGKRMIKDAGKYEFVSRTYDPRTGKFLQRDPMGYVDGTNMYVYCANNPLSNVDPFGTERKEVTTGSTGGSGGGSLDVPSRSDYLPPPLFKAPNPLPDIPKIDLPQAPPGTNFRAAESAGRARLRQLIPHAPGEQAQHYLKWRQGQATNLDPTITNDPRYMGPLQSRNALSTGGPYVINGRTYNNPHKFADRGLYPHYEQTLAPSVRKWGTERVAQVQVGRQVMKDMTGSRGPTPPYIVGPTIKGTTGHFIHGTAQYVVPFYAEAELAAFFGSHWAYSRGLLALGDAISFVGTRVLPVAGAFYVGLKIGSWIDEHTGWSTSLSNRAIRNRDIYKDMGLGDTASTILGGAANIPILSEIGEGLGWGAYKVYQGGSWVGGKISDAASNVYERFTSDEYTFIPWEAEWWPW